MIFDRIAIVFRRARSAPLRRAAAAQTVRWTEAERRDPRLAADLVTMGRVLALTPRDAASDRLAADAMQLAYEAGRRDLALELLAMMSLTPEDFRQMMEQDDA